MRTTTTEHLSRLQKNAKNIRNICILAHVDHGKTTLADALVASNGIISSRLAGKLRYMDSREDEQIRGITMKSSAISLHYSKGEEQYLINLIDSPGHVDFSTEVSTAVRLCDGALVVVDVVEGVSPQTHAVLRQAWTENIRPCLVLNKIDRLITELQYSPAEAYVHLQQILEQVNAITGTLFSSEVMEKSSSQPVNIEACQVREDDTAVCIDDWSSGLEETDDSNLYFSPDLGNVMFASAIDGWGFSIGDFVSLYSKKLGIKEELLHKTLWGDYYLDTKTKRIFKKAQAKGKKPLFVQFILQNIWAVYEAVMTRRDKIKIDQIVNALKLKISVRDSREPRVHLHAICNQWLPLATAVLSMVVEKLPSPLDLPDQRIEKLMSSALSTFDSLPPQTQKLKQDLMSCYPDDGVPVIVFVSKMFAVDDSALPKYRRRPLTQDEIAERREQARLRHAAQLMAEVTPTISTQCEAGRSQESNDNITTLETDSKTHFIGFARVYSGTIRKGQPLFILGPKHDPRNLKATKSLNDKISTELESQEEELASSMRCNTGQHVFTVGDLYLLMGRELETVDCVPAGNVLGIGGLQEHVLKSATISSTVACPPFMALPLAAQPIIRVAIEPVHASDMPALARGIQLLNQADPCVETLVQDTGEHVIVAAGEVHLQRCLDDLKEQYARVKLNVSDPIIPFRETIVPPPTVDMVNEAIIGDTGNPQDGEPCNDKLLAVVSTANKQCTVYIRAIALPARVVHLLNKNIDIIRLLANSTLPGRTTENMQNNSTIGRATRQHVTEFYQDLQGAFVEAGSQWHDAVNQIWAFGPRRTGPNILLNRIPTYSWRPSLWRALAEDASNSKFMNYDNSIVNGFQMTTLSGPMCAEPLMGVCFVIENLVMNPDQTGMTCPTRMSNSGLACSSSPTQVLSDERRILGDDKHANVFVEQSALSAGCHSGPSKSHHGADRCGPLSGQLMSAVKEGCRRAFQLQPMRLMAAMYSCRIQATADVLGRMYAVIAKREGQVLREDMKEGSDIFDVEAVIPVAESFGFAEDIRKRTSGVANPQLVFSHWQVLDMDPYWVPSTEQEYAHFGAKPDSENQARNYMNSVRLRKGMYVDEKTVEHAEKQRTLKK